MTVSYVQKQEVVGWVKETLAKLGCSDLQHKIYWSNGYVRCLGTALYKSSGCSELTFSVPLWDRASQQERYQCVVHEVCHLVARVRATTVEDPHGSTWRNCMVEMGLSPDRCHQVDRTGLGKTVKRYVFTCGCPGKEHKLTSQAYKAYVSRLKFYTCLKCKTKISIKSHTPILQKTV